MSLSTTESTTVSIICAAYNCESCVEETIKSVLNQTFSDWEMIIADDCSTDNSASVIKAIAKFNPQIKYVKLEKNSGPAVARNTGISMAKGRYIAFIDSDDVWHPEKLEKQVSFMQAEDAPASCTDYAHMDKDGVLTGRIIKCKKRCNYNACVWTNPIGNSTVMYDTQALGKLYYPLVPNREDYAMWLAMLRKTKYIYGISETLMYYRTGGSSFSSNKIKMAKYQYKVYRECEGFGVLRAAFHVCMWGVIKILHIK